MISSETEIAELKSKTFQILECPSTGINMGLFPEAVESTFGCKHHSHPVVPCVASWFFIASATYNIHIFVFSCRVFIGQVLSGLPHATEK